MGGFEVKLSSGEGFVVDGGVNGDVDRVGRKGGHWSTCGQCCWSRGFCLSCTHQHRA